MEKSATMLGNSGEKWRLPMAEQGKYYGQRLKAKNVLRLYAAGERDFRGTILRGCNFRGADLSGADFSRADIRSARFVDATLRGVRFCGAEAGLQRRWLVTQLALIVVFAILSASLQSFLAHVVATLTFAFASNSLGNVIALVTYLVIVTISYLLIACQGFTIAALGSMAITVICAFSTSAALAVANANAIAVAIIVATAGASASAIGSSVTFAIAGSINSAIAIIVAVAIVTTFAVNGFVTFTIAGSVSFAIATIIAFTTIVAIFSLLYSFYINQQIRKYNPKFENLRIISLVFSSLGGTSFGGTDLTKVFFTNAILKSTNFANSRQQATVFDYIRWHHAQKLDRARLGSSNLQDLRVRKTLITLDGQNKDLSNASFEGTNLANTQLLGANLNRANLNRANLQAAQLHNANLTEAQCIGTNFTAAQLTGVCLKAWNIDDTTILKDVDCNFAYLEEKPDAIGSRERLPHNPDKIFAPGDFEKYFREVMNEVKLLIRDGVDPTAFKTAFQQLMSQHNISPNDVRGIEKKGSDVMVTVAVPPDQSKGDIERTFDTHYEKALPASTAQKLLEAERQNKQEFIDFANKSIDRISNVLSNLTITNMNNPMNTTGDSNFVTGRDANITGSTLNWGDLSGQVSNQISQLPDAQSDRPSLKDLLNQLQTAIEQDTELSDDEKAEALGEVSKLAKAGANPKESKMQGLAKRATSTLKAIAETLTDTSKLATACKTLLPTIVALF